MRSKYVYKVSPAESLPVEDNSVTLIQAAAALHWLNYEKFYRECDRVLVPGGVIAAFSYTLNIHFDHPLAAEIAEVFLEMKTKLTSADNPYCEKREKLTLQKYTDESVQIPYRDSKRIDNEYIKVSTTVAGFLKFYRSVSLVRLYINSCPENMEWWNTCCQRFMEACGTADLETPLTYRIEAFLLLGRKPKIPASDDCEYN
ncbi:hypothetical protein EB796_002118 [Bugula neritina]|uniref:Methyltransferase type 11 domain-containing protein n=1 Tax=Bugula neritina TaxID=10212 RepID=A0A7J7KN24_BUGNE|nr:hypothetical protein EB796_002118 [Bugula neritina]